MSTPSAGATGPAATVRLAARALAWTLLLPGVVAGYVPWRFFGLREARPSWSAPLDLLALSIAAAGGVLLSACIVEFARRGRGTLSPVDPPRVLVVRGLYRYVRNPMYLSVTLVLLGEALVVRSWPLATYWAVWFLCVNAFVAGFEEPALRHRFGASYAAYTRQVGRWIPKRPPALFVALVTAGLVAGSPMARQDVPSQPALRLAWADEFDHDGPPDPAKWIFERGFVRNQELQWYQPENARVEDGRLIIEARREHLVNPDFDASSPDWRRNRPAAEYTSASLTTRDRYSFLYGRVEMRARIDTRAGLWPAFWTVGVSGRWPSGGEIDIMEYYRSMVLANVAWGGAQPGRAIWADTRTPLTSFPADWSRQFHIWRMDWDDQAIRLFVDDRPLNDVDLSRTMNQDGSGVNPFHQPQRVILNLAVGATGGDPAATTFPARYEIDYVRVYQPQQRVPAAVGTARPRRRSGRRARRRETRVLRAQWVGRDRGSRPSSGRGRR